MSRAGVLGSPKTRALSVLPPEAPVPFGGGDVSRPHPREASPCRARASGTPAGCACRCASATAFEGWALVATYGVLAVCALYE